jgi:xylulokinase
MKLNLEILENSGYVINELRVIGGGAKSQAWNQLKADVLGKSVTMPGITEAGCKGAAMLAMTAHSGEKAIDVAKSWEKPLSEINPVNKNIYEKAFTRYKEIYPLLKGKFF